MNSLRSLGSFFFKRQLRLGDVAVACRALTMSPKHPSGPVGAPDEPPKFADTRGFDRQEDLLDDVRSTAQRRGIEVREDELDTLPAELQQQFLNRSPGDQAEPSGPGRDPSLGPR